MSLLVFNTKYLILSLRIGVTDKTPFTKCQVSYVSYLRGKRIHLTCGLMTNDIVITGKRHFISVILLFALGVIFPGELKRFLK